MIDDEGVLGNLPRSRPGHRSEKRPERSGSGAEEATAAGPSRPARSAAGPAKTSARAASRAERTGARAAKAPPGSEPRGRARPKVAGDRSEATGDAREAARGRREATGDAREAARGRREATGDAREATGAPTGEDRADDRGGPVGDAVRTVTGVAATGARVAHGVAREVLRRLPRP